MRRQGENKKEDKYKSDYSKEFIDLIRKVARDRELLNELFIDVLSPAEYKEVAMRWQIVKLLYDGISQHEIARRLKISVATVGRGARMLANEDGGFNKVLKKYSERKKK